MADHSFNCAAADLLCAEENLNFLCFDDFDCLEQTHQLNNQNLFPKIGGSEPWIDYPPLLSVDSLCLMFDKEKDHLPRDDYLTRLRCGELDLSVRREAIDWIWKANAYYNFGPLSVCLSINYLDRFLSLHQMPRGEPWTIQLLAVACLSLAVKMEEIEVPKTLDLQVGDPDFVFDSKTIKRMELLVLSSLEWRMRAYTPFSFIDYFLTKMNNDQLPSEPLIHRSSQLILSTIRGIDLLEFRASEISAAVAMSVLGEMQSINIDDTISCFIHLEKGRVVKCVELIQDLALMMGGGSSSFSSLPQSPVGVLEAAATCLNYKRYYERTVGTCPNSPHTTPLAKRGKLDTTITSSSSQGNSTSSSHQN
ncbi:hypothetical protein LguiA_013695 [Lonicera macranthoides]